MDWMKDLMDKVYKPGALEMDPFSATLAKESALLSRGNNRSFIGCDVHSECLDAALQIFIYVFWKQVLDVGSDITVD